MEEDINLENGGEITPPPVITDPVDNKPSVISLTPEELDERIAAGVMSAVEKLRAQSQQQQQPAPAYDPTSEAISIQDVRDDMIEEAVELYADLPASYRAQIRKELRSIPADQIQGFAKAGIHKTVARNAAMTAIENGDYVPPKLKGKETPRVEPINSSVAGGLSSNQAKVPSAAASEINELFAHLGLPKPDDRKLAQAFREPASSGNHE